MVAYFPIWDDVALCKTYKRRILNALHGYQKSRKFQESVKNDATVGGLCRYVL